MIKKISRMQENEVGTGLEIVWNNGESNQITNIKLRQNCPCASCLEKRGDSGHSKPLSPRSRLQVLSHTIDEETNLEKIWVLGNYAIGMRWKDGHDSGIYTFEFLKSLSA